MFYCFDQNNSGGSFDIDGNVAQFVIIEAESAAQANERAESIGIYFNGVDEGHDCPCCGDRWYPVSGSDAEASPEIFGKDPAKYRGAFTERGEVYCYVYYLSNIVEEHRHYPDQMVD